MSIYIHEKLESDSLCKNNAFASNIAAYAKAVLESEELESSTLKLSLDNKETVSSEDKTTFIESLETLCNASSFALEVSYEGDEIVPVNDLEESSPAAYGLAGILLGRNAEFLYKYIVLDNNSGKTYAGEIVNGKATDINDRFSSSVVDLTGKSFYTYGIEAYADYETAAHPELAKKLSDCVCKYIPQDEADIMKRDFWSSVDDNRFIILSSQLNCESLAEMKKMLDEINEILKPVVTDSSKLGTDGMWYDTESFTVARIMPTDAGFEIVGAEF